jgi:hypothetical protein
MEPHTVDGWREKYEAENTSNLDLIHASTKCPNRIHGIAARQVLIARQQAEEEKRHRETTELSREEIAAAHYSNRLAWIAIWIAVLALAVAVYAAVK